METYRITYNASGEWELKKGRKLVATFFCRRAAEEAAGAMGRYVIDERAAQQPEAPYCQSDSDFILT